MSKRQQATGRPRSPTDIDRFVGAKVRELRLKEGITLQQLSGQIGLSHQQLQKYETGANRLSAGILPLVAEALGVELVDLFASSDTQESEHQTNAARLRAECERLLRRTKSEKALQEMALVLKALSV